MKYIHDHLKNKNNFKSLPPFFNDDRYLTPGTFNVLVIQTVCLTPCDQVFVLVGQQYQKTKNLNPNNSVTGAVK